MTKITLTTKLKEVSKATGIAVADLTVHAINYLDLLKKQADEAKGN